tara:strand:+ start:55833 stop:56183 length:351 start_codon:yes stop_codon:yes gene_type:complete
MSWVDGEIEKSASPIEVDVASLKLKGEDGKTIPTIEVLPLSAAEYQTLKSDPELKGLTPEDKQEILGLKLVHLMIQKCDSVVTWKKFRQLPLTTITSLATAVTGAVGIDGEGALGK